MAGRRASVAGTAADPLVRFATVELGGETYKLAFDFNAIATAETVAGVNLLQAIDLSGMTANQYRGMFYAALMKAHPEMTLAGAGQLITLPNIKRITDGILQAWRLAMPSPEEDEHPPVAAEGATDVA